MWSVAQFSAFVDANAAAVRSAQPDPARNEVTLQRPRLKELTRHLLQAIPKEPGNGLLLLLRTIVALFPKSVFCVSWAALMTRLRVAAIALRDHLRAERDRGRTGMYLWVDTRRLWESSSFWCACYLWHTVEHLGKCFDGIITASAGDSAPPPPGATVVMTDVFLYTIDPLWLETMERFRAANIMVCAAQATVTADAQLPARTARRDYYVLRSHSLVSLVGGARGMTAELMDFWRLVRERAPHTALAGMPFAHYGALLDQYSAHATEPVVVTAMALPPLSVMLPLALTWPAEPRSAGAEGASREEALVRHDSLLVVGEPPDRRPFFVTHTWRDPEGLLRPPPPAPPEPAKKRARRSAPRKKRAPPPAEPPPAEEPSVDLTPLSPPPPDDDLFLPDVDPFPWEDAPRSPWSFSCVMHPDRAAAWFCSACACDTSRALAAVGRFCSPACHVYSRHRLYCCNSDTILLPN
jgi:hypothetical protein